MSLSCLSAISLWSHSSSAFSLSMNNWGGTDVSKQAKVNMSTAVTGGDSGLFYCSTPSYYWVIWKRKGHNSLSVRLIGFKCTSSEFGNQNANDIFWIRNTLELKWMFCPFNPLNCKVSGIQNHIYYYDYYFKLLKFEMQKVQMTQYMNSHPMHVLWLAALTVKFSFSVSIA